MNILFINNFVVDFIFSEIPRVYVFGYFPLYDQFNCKFNFDNQVRQI